MTANTSPIFTLTPTISWGKITGVDSSTDGTGADVQLVFTADATDGSFLRKIRAQPLSTSGSTTTSAASLRLYWNNGNSVGTGTNNVLAYDFLLAAIPVSTTGTVGVVGYEYVINEQIPAGYKVYAGITAMAANTQWNVIAYGGEYN